MEDMEKNIRIRVIISGRVQGVGFRFATQRQANKLGLSGWVKNKSNGDVEAALEGRSSSVESMVLWCYKGPVMAHVTDVKVKKEVCTGECSPFFIKASS